MALSFAFFVLAGKWFYKAIPEQGETTAKLTEFLANTPDAQINRRQIVRFLKTSTNAAEDMLG